MVVTKLCCLLERDAVQFVDIYQLYGRNCCLNIQARRVTKCDIAKKAVIFSSENIGALLPNLLECSKPELKKIIHSATLVCRLPTQITANCQAVSDPSKRK